MFHLGSAGDRSGVVQRTDDVYPCYVLIAVAPTMNLTLSINDEVLKKAREAVKAQGKSINQLIREYLQQLTGQSAVDEAIDRFQRTCR